MLRSNTSNQSDNQDAYMQILYYGSLIMATYLQY